MGRKKGGEGGERCAFPGAPRAPLPVPLPSSATDVIRYHAFVPVRFRAGCDIKLRKRKRERDEKRATSKIGRLSAKNNCGRRLCFPRK